MTKKNGLHKAETLIGNLRNGDIKAFEEIFALYSGKITRFIRTIIKSESDAEDLTQTIFAKIWESRETFNPQTSLDSYMYTIARNAALNFIKSKKLHDTIIGDTASDTTGSTTDEQVNSGEIERIMDSLAGSMPGQSEHIYRLSQKEGLSPDEIAEKLDLNTKTVRNQLSLIFRQLRGAVDNYLQI